jgi:hypothetical protein
MSQEARDAREVERFPFVDTPANANANAYEGIPMKTVGTSGLVRKAAIPENVPVVAPTTFRTIPVVAAPVDCRAHDAPP